MALCLLNKQLSVCINLYILFSDAVGGLFLGSVQLLSYMHLVIFNIVYNHFVLFKSLVLFLGVLIGFIYTTKAYISFKPYFSIGALSVTGRCRKDFST